MNMAEKSRCLRELIHAEETLVKVLLYVVAVVLILMGGVWFFQGIGVLPGSVMTGQTRWAIYGGIAVVAGVVVLALAMRRRRVKK